jgi:hypothetical protein
MMTDDMNAVVTAIASLDDGRGTFDRPALLARTGLTAARLADAIELLESSSCVKLDRAIGGHFYAELTWRGREAAGIASPKHDAATLRAWLAQYGDGEQRGREFADLDDITAGLQIAEGRVRDAAAVLIEAGQADDRRTSGGGLWVRLTARGRGAVAA